MACNLQSSRYDGNKPVEGKDRKSRFFHISNLYCQVIMPQQQRWLLVQHAKVNLTSWELAGSNTVIIASSRARHILNNSTFYIEEGW